MCKKSKDNQIITYQIRYYELCNARDREKNLILMNRRLLLEKGYQLRKELKQKQLKDIRLITTRLNFMQYELQIKLF